QPNPLSPRYTAQRRRRGRTLSFSALRGHPNQGLHRRQAQASLRPRFAPSAVLSPPRTFLPDKLDTKHCHCHLASQSYTHGHSLVLFGNNNEAVLSPLWPRCRLPPTKCWHLRDKKVFR